MRNTSRPRAASRCSALVATIVICLIGCSEAGPSSSSGSPDGCAETTSDPDAVLPGSVLFARSGDGDVHTIFLLAAGCETQLTEPGAYGLGRLSPDHRRVSVIPGGEIPPPLTGGTIDLEGRDFERFTLTDPTLNMIPGPWSPDASRMAFEAWDDSDPSRTGIYTARVSDGGDLVRVTTRPGPRHDIPLDYSPDGTQLVFYRSVHTDPDPQVGGSLWVVGVDGTGAHRISGNAQPADWARWSPDGQKILFATERTAPSGALWTVSPDGSDLVELFVDPDGGFPITPTWSPDGSQILFGLDPTNDEFTHPDNSLVLIGSDGADLQEIITTPDFKRWPEWW